MSKLYLTIDSYSLEKPAQNFTLQLDIREYSKVALKHVHIQHETDATKLFYFNTDAMPLYVHCSLLNEDDNLINGKKSNVIAILYPETKSQKFMSVKPASNSSKLIKYDNKIGISLTNCHGTLVESKSKFSIIYELEFS